MKSKKGYAVLLPEDLPWRESDIMKIPSVYITIPLGSENMGARYWRFPPYSANTWHKHIRAEELYIVLEGTGRIRVEDETITVPKYGAVLVAPEKLRQVFNDTSQDVLWFIVGAPEQELEEGEESRPEMYYPEDPKQLPKELNGHRWPPKSEK